jgi:hypothetical protein
MARDVQQGGPMSNSARLISASVLLAGLLVAGLIVGSLVNLVARTPRADADAAASQVVIGQAEGVALPPTPGATPATPAPPSATEPGGSTGTSLTATSEATPSPTPSPTPSDVGEASTDDGFSADVVVCSSVSGSTCHGQTSTISSGTATIWLMVAFRDAGDGDRIGMGLSGPGGSRDGGSYAVKGGDGRAWAQVSGRLEPGQYTVTATRNGEVVAQSPLEVR